MIKRYSSSKNILGGIYRYRGLTLIELLVVIATIGVLVAIVISVTAQVRRGAMQTEAAAKLRGVGLAIQFYIDDAEGRFPGWLNGYQTPVAANHRQLIYYIQPYLTERVVGNTEVNKVYVSRAYWGWLNQYGFNPSDYRLSYVYVMYNNHRGEDGLNYKPWSRDNPNDDMAPSQPMRQADFNNLFTPSSARAMWDAQVDAAGGSRPVSPQFGELYGRRNVLFFDWHVESVPASNSLTAR